MKTEDLLIEYGKLKGLGTLDFNKQGVCHLTFNDTLLVSIEKSFDGEGLFIYSIVGELPLDKEKEIATTILEANLFGKETGPCVLGYDSRIRSIILFRYVSEEKLDLNSFQDELTQFFYYLAHWLAKFESICSKTADEHLDKFNKKNYL